MGEVGDRQRGTSHGPDTANRLSSLGVALKLSKTTDTPENSTAEELHKNNWHGGLSLPVTSINQVSTYVGYLLAGPAKAEKNRDYRRL